MSDIDINRWKYYENLEKECQTLEHQVKFKSQNIQRLIQDICTLKKVKVYSEILDIFFSI